MQCGLDDAWGRQRLSGYGGSWVCIGVLGKGRWWWCLAWLHGLEGYDDWVQSG
ncbi:hypothetical protein JHK86_022980 [Glycine max]|nr:hypothetical protein JHK86_022980 [Glycine max]